MEASTHATLQRLAKRYIYLDEEIRFCEGEPETLVEQTKSALTAVKEISTVIASQLHITAGGNPQRLNS